MTYSTDQQSKEQQTGSQLNWSWSIAFGSPECPAFSRVHPAAPQMELGALWVKTFKVSCSAQIMGQEVHVEHSFSPQFPKLTLLGRIKEIPFKSNAICA